MVETARHQALASVDLETDGWLAQLLSAIRPELLAVGAAVAPLEMGHAGFEVWTSRIVDALPFGFDDVEVGAGEPGPGRYLLLAGLADMASLVASVAAVSDRQLREDTAALDVAMVLAGLICETGAMREIGAVREDVVAGKLTADERVAALRRPMRTVGKALEGDRLPDEHPLLGRPFHRVITHARARSVAHLARAQALGRLDEAEVLREDARSQVGRTTVIEAVISLACIDGRVARMEARLVRELIVLARLDPEDASRLRDELADREGPSPAELAERIDDPADRQEILKMVMFAALVDDELTHAEEMFIEQLAEALDIAVADRVRIFGDIARAVALHPGLLEGLRADYLLGRTRRSATRVVEAFVTRNAKRIGNELMETGELLALLARWTHDDLSEAERDAVSEQITDILRSVPALALFAAPGGSLLIPVLAKVLPFSIAPSSFKEPEDPDLVADSDVEQD